MPPATLLTTTLGDLVIPLRPWPTPDPAKCDENDDRIGVFLDSDYPIPYGCTLAELGEWTCAWDLDVPNIGPEADGPGWCWISEPTHLAWVEGRDDRGRPTWTATTVGPVFTITEYLVGRSTLAVWELEGFEHDHGPFSSFEDAQRTAAVHARDVRTRRAP